MNHEVSEFGASRKAGILSERIAVLAFLDRILENEAQIPPVARTHTGLLELARNAILAGKHRPVDS